MTYLFQVSIGPVQEFIASARRSRDLYRGSWLLSELSKAAALAIAEACGPKSLIFPAPDNIGNLKSPDLNVANKIVARIEGEPKEVSQQAQKAIEERLNEVARFALPEQMDAIYRALANQQIKELVEYYWVALPLHDDKQYADTRTMLEALLAARKNTRNFNAVVFKNDLYAKQPKSSISGQLESVIPQHLYPNKEDNDFKRIKKIRDLYTTYGAGPSEKLSGVDLLKRLGEDKVNFPSTSHIAAIPYIERLTEFLQSINDEVERNKVDGILRNKWKEYLDVVGQDLVEKTYDYYDKHKYPAPPIIGISDGSILFVERLLASIDKSQSRTAQGALSNFLEAVNKQLGENISPNPYYAILLADGDGMGKVIDHQAHEGYEQHRKLSNKLAAFSQSVRGIVRSHGGGLIYAGGDDVLALLPLHTVLACARDLAEKYYEAMKDFLNKDGKSSTLSAGIAIVHHLSLWQESLEVARSAEKRAKRVDDKHAIAITLQRRSGEAYEIAGPRAILLDYVNPKTGQVTKGHLEQLVNHLLADNLPRGTAYELRTLRERMVIEPTMSDDEKQELEPVLYTDARRILKRKISMRHAPDKAKIERLLTPLLEIAGLQDEPPPFKRDTTQKDTQPTISQCLEHFIEALIIAQALADAQQLAIGKQQAKEKADAYLAH